jgi:hypothetical protein
MASREKVHDVVVRPLQEMAQQMFGSPDDRQASLAEAWEQGYKAGWVDFYRDKKAFEEDKPDIVVTPNPYRA